MVRPAADGVVLGAADRPERGQVPTGQGRDRAEAAARWAAQGWPARVDDTGRALTAEYSAPSAGPPPWFVYRLALRLATALGTVEPGGATRWRF